MKRGTGFVPAFEASAELLLLRAESEERRVVLWLRGASGALNSMHCELAYDAAHSSLPSAVLLRRKIGGAVIACARFSDIALAAIEERDGE